MFSLLRRKAVCCAAIAGAFVFPDCALSQSPTPSPTPKPSPDAGGRGTVEFWQKELKGKFKPQVKADLGAPTGGIEKNGDIYIYKEEFFHPDLDQWRDLRIMFSAQDGAVESFTGSGGDTKPYPVEVPTADEVAPPTPTPTPEPNYDDVRKKVQTSVVTVEYSEPYVDRAGNGPQFDQGTGATGFIVAYKGKKYVLTNIHVLEGEASTEVQMAWVHGPRVKGRLGERSAMKARINDSFDGFLKTISGMPIPRIKTVDGKDLKPGADLLLCGDRDIALIPVETDIPALSISTEPPLSDSVVVVVGNAYAAHTIVSMQGSVTQNGPERFNVAPKMGESPMLAAGMSGSPVVDLRTGNVLGVISYVVVHEPSWFGDKVVAGPLGASVVRYFSVRIDNTAYRLDNLDNLQTIPWPTFLKDYAAYWAKRERTFNVNYATDAVEASVKGTSPYTFQPDYDNAVQLAYSSFCRDFRRVKDTSDEKYIMDSWDSYRRKLENFLREDPYPITTPYIKLQLSTIATASSQTVVQKLQAEQGRVTSLAAGARETAKSKRKSN